MDLYLLIFNILDIPQQFQEFVCVFFHGQLYQFHLMELFNLIIIVHAREVLLPEILLELFPPNLPLFDLLHLPEVIPPYGCSSSQIEDGYPSLHISRVVLDLEIFPHPKELSFSFLTNLYITIKGKRYCLFKLIV